MLEMIITEEACRGCELCVDICPTNVIEFAADKKVAVVKQVEDCIACLSCAYICPSGAIEHKNYHAVPNFYRDREFSARMEKYL